MNHVAAPEEAIAQTFADCRAANQPVFMPFVMGGYPTYQDSIEIALTLQETGAQILEVGFPYSDPLADGPTIQKASDIALQQGLTLTRGLQLIKDMRAAGITIPLIIFCYYNPILKKGISAFVQEAIEAGANGVIIPDLPYEESEEIRLISAEHQFAFISLIAPNSRKRIEAIAQQAKGFIYCISSLGVTGARDQFADQLEEYIEQVRLHAQVPLAVGFGVSKKEQVRYLADKVDGIIIASALIDRIHSRLDEYEDPAVKREVLDSIKVFVAELFSK